MVLTKKKDPKSSKSHAGHLPTKSLKVTLKILFSNAYFSNHCCQRQTSEGKVVYIDQSKQLYQNKRAWHTQSHYFA